MSYNRFEYEHETPLHRAARTGNLKNVRRICTKDNIDLQDYYDYTSLMNTILEDHSDIFKFLLNQGADPDIRDGQRRTALAISAEFGRSEYVELLLQASEDETVLKKPDVNSTDSSTRTPLMLAIDNCTWGPAIVKSFFNHPKNIDFAKTESFKRTALYHAIEQGVEEALTLLIKQHKDHGRDIGLNIQDRNGLTALHKAVEMRKKGAVEALLSLPSIKLTVEDKEGRTPLIIAKQKGSREIAKLLLGHQFIKRQLEEKAEQYEKLKAQGHYYYANRPIRPRAPEPAEPYPPIGPPRVHSPIGHREIPTAASPADLSIPASDNIPTNQ